MICIIDDLIKFRRFKRRCSGLDSNFPSAKVVIFYPLAIEYDFTMGKYRKFPKYSDTKNKLL